MDTFELISNGFMLCMISVSLLLNKYANSIVTHGYTDKLLSKNHFKDFYLFAILLYIAKANTYNVYIVHLIRRFFEVIIFKYSIKNRMSLLQYLISFVYYYFVVINLVNKNINNMSFLYANILQFLAHLCIYNKIYFVYAHYYCEILIYLIVFINIRNVFCGLNLIWVVVYYYISRSNRNRLNKMY